MTLDSDGRVVRFTGVADDPGRARSRGCCSARDKRPDKLDWRVDMKGRTMLPGFVDAHGHVMDLGFRALQLDLSDTRSLAEAQAKIAAYAAGQSRPALDLGRRLEPGELGAGPLPDRGRTRRGDRRPAGVAVARRRPCAWANTRGAAGGGRDREVGVAARRADREAGAATERRVRRCRAGAGAEGSAAAHSRSNATPRSSRRRTSCCRSGSRRRRTWARRSTTG